MHAELWYFAWECDKRADVQYVESWIKREHNQNINTKINPILTSAIQILKYMNYKYHCYGQYNLV